MTDRMARRLDEARAESGNIKKRAFADLQKLSRTFIGLLLIADDLTEVGDLEEAAARARAACQQATEELAGKRAEIDAAKAAHSRVEAQFAHMKATLRAEFETADDELKAAITARDQAISDARTQAAEIIEKATLEAVAIAAAAKSDAAGIVTAANAEAALKQDGADDYIAEARGRLEAVEMEIRAANSRLAGIKAAIAQYASV